MKSPKVDPKAGEGENDYFLAGRLGEISLTLLSDGRTSITPPPAPCCSASDFTAFRFRCIFHGCSGISCGCFYHEPGLAASPALCALQVLKGSSAGTERPRLLLYSCMEHKLMTLRTRWCSALLFSFKLAACCNV